MAEHEFVCDSCKVMVTDSNTKIIHRCPQCNGDMRWDIRIGGHQGDFCQISDALAINPCQIDEHQQMFPDVKIHPTGQLEFNDIKKYDDYMDKTGFVKLSQKTKIKGKTLATL